MFSLSIRKLRKLTNPELVAFANDMSRIFNSVGSLPSKIVECLEALMSTSIELKEVSIDGTGKASTKKINFLDAQRIRVVRSIGNLLKSLTLSSDVSLAEQATMLSSHFDQHRNKMDRGSNKNKTTAINKILEEWATDPKLAEACKSVFLRNEKEDLAKWNKEFEDHFFENAQTNSRKKNVPVKKENVLNAFSKLQKMTESFYNVSDDTTMYEEINQKSEKLIEKYFIPVSIRKAARKSKPELVSAAATGAENNAATTAAAVKDSEE
ncbi:MAG: hypothetical protein IPN79_03140 [Saprospiraceae bacterium]|nr:hypothetical protein [Saprospiraceae bacterium]